MKTADDVRNTMLEYGSDDFYVMDEWADAFVGVSNDGQAVYDYYEIMRIMIKEYGVSDEEAMDWISYNILGSMPSIETKYPIIIYGERYEGID